MPTLSPEQIQEAKNRGVSDAQIKRYLETGSAIQTPQDIQKPKQSIAEGFVAGLGKSAGATILGIGQLGRDIQRGIAKVTPLSLMEDELGLSPFDVGSESNLALREKVTPETGAEKVGKFTGDVAQFAIPGAKAAKGTQGMGMLTRALTQGAVAGVVESAQEGKVGKSAAIAAGVGAASVPIGDAISAGAKKIAKNLPEWLVRPLVKQTKTAKEQGKDIVPFMVEKGRVGSVESLINQSDDSMQVLNAKIQTALNNSNKTVNLRQIAVDVADDINAAGGSTTADDVLSIIQKQAFQTRGILQNAGDDIAIAKANAVRSQLDDTLYAGKDYLRQTPTENKAVLEAFTNKLRGTVQGLEPSTKPAFAEFSKEITLKNALRSAAASSQGRNTLSLMDLVVGGGAYTATGDPVSTVGLVVGRRAFETPQVKTTLAKVFSNVDDVIDVLSKASPQTRGVFIKAIDNLLEEQDESMKEQR